jgi:hypothetical protein
MQNRYLGALAALAAALALFGGAANTQAADPRAATATPARTVTQLSPTPHPKALLDRLYRDEKGRIIGGMQFPLVNYSPTMITGKPCPRIKAWTYKVQATKPPRAKPSDPCVIQNALDDMVKMLWFFPGEVAPEEWPTVYAQYDDPFWKRAVPDVTGLRLNWKRTYPNQWTWNKCNKPVYTLVDASSDTPLVPYDVRNEINGKNIRFLTFAATFDVGTYKCDWYDSKGRPTGGSFDLTAARIAKGDAVIYEFAMVYDAKIDQWVLGGYFPFDVPDYKARVQRLWRESPIKP